MVSCMFCVSSAPTFASYVASLPPGRRPFLEKELDWDSEGVNRDLHEIAHHMLDWEVKLSSHLNLTDIDISDIKEELQNPELRR